MPSAIPHDIPHVYVTTSYVPLKPLICVLYESSSILNPVYLTPNIYGSAYTAFGMACF